MRFIDLYAGLGGFHIALNRLGHECVFASELNENLKNIYEQNFNIKIHGDINQIKCNEIPAHDILCAGFPCQPFSKAGKQLGLKDDRGSHVEDNIARILKYHKPSYFILENVPNLTKHNREKTWTRINKMLTNELGYEVKHAILSPHEFGVPQIRKRVYIVGSRVGLDHFEFPTPILEKTNIKRCLDKNPKDAKKLTEDQINALEMWQRILDKLPKKEKLPHPCWAMEFGATYPYKKITPFATNSKTLGKGKGTLGKTLKNLSKKKQLEKLPNYAKMKCEKFPKWKIKFIERNRKFYKKNKKILAPFIKELKKLPSTHQKLEWNCGEESRNIFNKIIQFRPSGIRVKKTEYAPALVVCASQNPVITWEKRYLTTREAARLQGMHEIILPENPNNCMESLGNAVNVDVVHLIAKNLLIHEIINPPIKIRMR